MHTLEKVAPSTTRKTKLSKDQQKLLDRMISILTPTTVQIAEDRELSQALSMNDGELLQFVYDKQWERNALISKRELRMIHTLNEGTRKLSERLKELGGALKAGQVAECLQITRQTVSNWRKANKLLALKPANEYLFPAFQFQNSQVITGVEEVLELLGDDLSPVTKMSFFTAMYYFGESGPNVIDALKSMNSDDYLEVIKNKASTFGRHIAQ